MLSGCLEAEVEALGGKMAEHEEDRRNSEASGSEWSEQTRRRSCLIIRDGVKTHGRALCKHPLSNPSKLAAG